MSTTCKSPRRVLQVAYAVAKKALPAYGHRCSPKKFTQHQLMACLVLKAFRRLDYRGLAAELIDNPGYCALIELKKVPHFTTFQKAERRLLRVSAAAKLLTATIDQAVASKIMRRRVELGAVDGTGFESRHISAYFVKRRKRCKPGYETITYTRYPKAGILCDCRSHLILAVVPGRGPGPDDLHYRQALQAATSRIPITTLLADAGYDSEAAHVLARDVFGVRTIIPPTRGRPLKHARLPRSRWRRRMATHWKGERYGQRWQAETTISMIKRLLGSALTARRYWSQCREITLRAITLNVMILLPWIGFLQSKPDPFTLLVFQGCSTLRTTPSDVACQVVPAPATMSWRDDPAPSAPHARAPY